MLTNSTAIPIMSILKGLLGYTIGFAPLFVILALVFKVPLRQLAAPYFLLMVPFILFVVIQQGAAKHLTSPPLRLSLATGVSLLLCLPVFTHYGTKFGLFGPDFAALVLWWGAAGSIIMSVMVFQLRRRRG